MMPTELLIISTTVEEDKGLEAEINYFIPN